MSDKRVLDAGVKKGLKRLVVSTRNVLEALKLAAAEEMKGDLELANGIQEAEEALQKAEDAYGVKKKKK